VSVTLTVFYVAFAVWFSQPWRSELEEAIGPIATWVIPVLLAYVPALVIGFLCFTLLLTRYRPPPLVPPSGPWPSGEWPPLTVIIAAYNEERAIATTLEHVAASDYAGPLEVVLADNNSTDRTAGLSAAAAQRLGLDHRRSFEATAGKHHALNTALVHVETPIVVTVDADTLLVRPALTYLIARVASRPQNQHVSACAGALIAENGNRNFLTRMQGWDYRLGINGVKRTQAAYNCALVAQGAFSAYWTDGHPLLFSWWSMLVIPITLAVYGLLRRWQDRNVFRVLGVRPERDRRGFFGYLFGYQALTSAASLRGYAQQILGAGRRWK
jgi:poly-beta-1,6-N-acetyl-D-glucosamine synthase